MDKDTVSFDSDANVESVEPDPTVELIPGTHDPVRLFQVSRELDRLRDDCRWLLRRAPDLMVSPALEEVTERLVRLHGRLLELLDEQRQASLQADVSSVQAKTMVGVMVAAGQLAAWVDGVLLAPAFLNNQHAQEFNHTMLKRMRGDKDTELETPSASTIGTYL